MLGLTWYGINTRDATIRARAEEFLREATGGDVTVDNAKFRMFGGITLEKVRVAVRYDESLDPSAKSLEAREIFSARQVRLIHDPWRLLFGSLHVQRVVASGPHITLVHNVDTDVRNWQLLTPHAQRSSAASSGGRPVIAIRSAIATIVSVNSSGKRESDDEQLVADFARALLADTGF